MANKDDDDKLGKVKTQKGNRGRLLLLALVLVFLFFRKSIFSQSRSDEEQDEELLQLEKQNTEALKNSKVNHLFF